jgi:hypothetical protein
VALEKGPGGESTAMRMPLRDELELIVRIEALDAESARGVNARGQEATFVDQRV